jgi:Na+-driven multidrug efflux pump
MAFGLHFVYGYSENDAQTFGIFSVAYSNTLMIVFGALAYLLYFLEMRKLSKLNS